MSETALGLDLSLTNTGIVRMTKNLRVVNEQSVKTKPDNADPYSLQVRITHILKQVMPLARRSTYVVVEDHGYHARVGMDTRQIAVAENVKQALFRRGIPFLLATPGEVKKLATGKGNASKQMMQDSCIGVFEPGVTNHNMADAYWLARWAWSDLSLA